MSLRSSLRGLRCLARQHMGAAVTSTAPKGSGFSTATPRLKEQKVHVTFILASGQRIEGQGKVGETLLDVVVNDDLPIEGFGACEGTLTCSTCHVILKPEDYNRISNEPLDEENDMLELAYGLTDTSRLGCQITLTTDLDGLEVTIPETINDQRSS